MRFLFMQAWPRLVCAVTAVGVLTLAGCAELNAGAYPAPPSGLQTVIDPNDKAAFPSTAPSNDPFAPALEMMVTKSMLYSAAMKHGVNPYLVMGLAWHESGWNPSAISSAGAVGIMQVMPATAAASGPALLNRKVNLYDPADNIDVGTAILRSNLDRWQNDLAKALVAYYAGGGAVREWGALTHDEQRYVWAVYHAAMLFKEGKGPV
jgi:soluble lytic murein transglycosylase-like protein